MDEARSGGQIFALMIVTNKNKFVLNYNIAMALLFFYVLVYLVLYDSICCGVLENKDWFVNNMLKNGY